MTKREIKQAAQKAMKENGIKVQQTNMTLLEAGSRNKVVDYVMFTDRKTGRTYQCNYGAKYYNHEKNTLWKVYECDDYGCEI